MAPDDRRRRWLILTTVCGSLLAVMFANSSLNLAIPVIATELKLSSLQLTWIIEIYSLLFAGLLFTCGAVGDRYGRKVLMQIGLGLFVVSSLYAGFVASTGIELMVVRALMGIGGAMVMPTTLSVINVVFAPEERARAVAIWAGIAGVGMLFGLVAGGALLDSFGWKTPFVLGAGIAVASLVVNQFLVTESRDEKRTPVDWLGGALSTAGLVGLVYGIMESPTRGLGDRSVLAGLVTACVCLVAFVFWQLRTTHPMLDVRLFAHRAFSVAALAVMLAFFALGGVLFGMSQLFMLVMGYGALKTSLSFIPIMLPMAFLAPVVPRVNAKLGSRWTVAMGLFLVAVAFLVMTNWPTIPSFWQVMGGMLIISVGITFAMTPATNMMMSVVPRSRSGMGSAMNDTTRELGGALGVAVLGALLSSGYSAHIASSVAGLPEQVRPLVEKSLAGALFVSEKMGALAGGLPGSAKAAWMDSLRTSMIVAAIICAAASVIAALWMPHRENRPAEQTALLKPGEGLGLEEA